MDPSFQQQLQSWAARNDELVKILTDTDYAPAAIKQQQAYISDVQNELIRHKTSIRDSEQKLLRERLNHEKYSKSILKRFTYKAVGQSGKFDAKAEQEEREYFEALQDSRNAKERKAHLEQQVTKAQSAIAGLEYVVQKHTDTQTELDALYNSLFSGPTPGLPKEDQAEQQTNIRIEIYRATRTKWETEDQALRILGDAERTFDQARSAIKAALGHSKRDMWGGGTMTDMMERNELTRAQCLTSTVYMLYSQAQRFSQLPDIPKINIDQGHIMSDVIFDNIFSDMAQHDRINDAKAAMDRGYTQLMKNKNVCKARVDALQSQLNREEQAILEARKELQKIRQQAFRDAAAPPPAYNT